jgi:hypothetical protein
MSNNSNRQRASRGRMPPPDLRRLMVAGMLGAARGAVRVGYDLPDCHMNDLRQIVRDLERVAEVLADDTRHGDSYDADCAEAELILDDLLDRLRIGGPDPCGSCDCEPPPPRRLAVTVTVEEVPS